MTALQLDASPGLLQNTGLAANLALTRAISAYNTADLIAPLLATMANSASANLSAITVSTLENLASNSCPALADSCPSGHATLSVGTNLFTGLILDRANTYMGNGDLTRFAQVLNQAQSYAEQTSIFINTAVNSQTYLSNTFTNIDNMITGDITQINLATQALGQDLESLGNLINLADLGNFGSPLGLIQQIYSVTGAIAEVNAVFVLVGIPVEIVLTLTDPTVSVTDSIQRLMYQAMTQITGVSLNQILTVMKVTTPGITTMADLLNPFKLFPNSFQSLTVPTKHGLRAIYVNATGSVNQNLLTELPPYVIQSLT